MSNPPSFTPSDLRQLFHNSERKKMIELSETYIQTARNESLIIYNLILKKAELGHQTFATTFGESQRQAFDEEKSDYKYRYLLPPTYKNFNWRIINYIIDFLKKYFPGAEVTFDRGVGGNNRVIIVNWDV